MGFGERLANEIDEQIRVGAKTPIHTLIEVMTFGERLSGQMDPLIESEGCSSRMLNTLPQYVRHWRQVDGAAFAAKTELNQKF